MPVDSSRRYAIAPSVPSRRAASSMARWRIASGSAGAAAGRSGVARFAAAFATRLAGLAAGGFVACFAGGVAPFAGFAVLAAFAFEAVGFAGPAAFAVFVVSPVGFAVVAGFAAFAVGFAAFAVGFAAFAVCFAAFAVGFAGFTTFRFVAVGFALFPPLLPFRPLPALVPFAPFGAASRVPLPAASANSSAAARVTDAGGRRGRVVATRGGYSPILRIRDRRTSRVQMI
jgi:hypothetical protein